ncbi:hypothetical protein BA893_06880 [Vibrio natriegens]|uniref:hypothetical protein n=1 Tax=Vibrio natriegens TaxID=691 RepID=UPI0008040539|nr:hypothetical protein [Vibrio natriegens]ANQ21404.1 hypothetical protein BA893_06880 [Vibrio natriegens]
MRNSSKPEYIVDLTEGATTALEALTWLSIVPSGVGCHESKRLRKPLGIYNTSLQRIFSKLDKCCNKLQAYFTHASTTDGLAAVVDLQAEILDYIELSLYSAAEHVDDIESIASGFFSNTKECKKSPHVKKLNADIKVLKKFISSAVNGIKHQQSRIRFYSVDIKHEHRVFCLHGYFIEGVNNGVVGPCKILHGQNNQIFSITSLVWEIICFVLNCSRSLANFLSKTLDVAKSNDVQQFPLFIKVVTSASKLPVYSFDDLHPFDRTRIILQVDDPEVLNSSLYGSLACSWSKSRDLVILRDQMGYVSDGVTRTFDIAVPKNLGLKHWA